MAAQIQKYRAHFQKLLPRHYGHRAFFIKVSHKLTFRIYKIEHLFADVGETWIVDFFVSYRDLRKLRAFPYRNPDLRSFSMEFPLNDIATVRESLIRTGFYNLEKYFRE